MFYPELNKCKNCGAFIDEEEEVCSFCGYKRKLNPVKNKREWIIFSIVMLLMMVVLILFRYKWWVMFG